MFLVVCWWDLLLLFSDISLVSGPGPLPRSSAVHSGLGPLKPTSNRENAATHMPTGQPDGASSKIEIPFLQVCQAERQV